MIEREGLRVLIDPHTDDFVGDGLAALRVLRGINSKSISFVSVAPHTFHIGNLPLEIVRAAGDRL